MPSATPPLLSVIIPAYNEAATLGRMLDAVKVAAYVGQIIVVDDGSTDRTFNVVQNWQERTGMSIDIVRQPRNQGKGAAIRAALGLVRRELVLVQDADLECDPADYSVLVDEILSGRAVAVYGSRYLRPSACLRWSWNRLGVGLLNLLVFLLYQRRLTDEATCYKVMPTELLRALDLRCQRFEFCPEVTAKLCRLRLPIQEVSVRYTPRTIRQGKKIRWWDGAVAVATLIQWRLLPFRPLEVDWAEASRLATKSSDRDVASGLSTGLEDWFAENCLAKIETWPQNQSGDPSVISTATEGPLS